MYLYNLLVFSGIISNATRLFCVPGLLYVTYWPELKTAQYLYERRSDIKSRNKKKKKKNFKDWHWHHKQPKETLFDAKTEKIMIFKQET